MIEELHEIAVELLKKAQAFNDALDHAESSPLAPKNLAGLLDELCKTLGRVHDLLSRSDSPLAAIEKFFDGGSLRFEKQLKRFLAEHREALGRFGVSKKLVDLLIGHLGEHVGRRGEHDLEKSEGFDAQPVLDAIKDFRDLVCRAAGLVDGVANVPHDILKGVAEGTMGTALVVVDVTTVALVGPQDVTMWTWFKAARSVWSGVTMIRSAVGRLKDGMTSLQAMRRQAKLKSMKPPRGPFGKGR